MTRPWRELAGGDRVHVAIMAIFALLLVVLIAYPFANIFGMSLREPKTAVLTLGNYGLLFSEPALRSALQNSMVIASVTMVICVGLAVPVAWGLARTDLPLKGLIKTCLVLTYASPGFIAAIAWTFLLGPRGGNINVLLRNVFGLEQPLFNIFTWGGIVFVLALLAYPMIVFVVTAALERMDPTLEESARGLGAGEIRTMMTIAVPLVMPAVLAGAILVFVHALVIYGPPALLGTPFGFHTLATLTREVVTFPPPRFELGAVLAVPIIVSLGILLFLRRALLGRRGYATIGGKAMQWQVVRLGPWKYVLLTYCLTLIFTAILLPFGTLALLSAVRAIAYPISPDNFNLINNYAVVFKQGQLARALTNSLGLALGGTALAITLGLIGGWLIERTKTSGKGFLSLMMTASYCFPGVVVGVGLVLAYSGPPMELYGTIWIILLAYVIHGLPLAFMFLSSALKQLGPELEEAARGLGATWLVYTRDITVPLISNAVLAVGTLLVVSLFRELNASIFLQSTGNEVVAPMIIEMYVDSRYPPMAALSTIVVILTTVMVMLARRGVSDYLMRR